jgi:type III pantothenate kinase
MLLTIDIGNTNVSVGLFDGKKLRHHFDIATRAYRQKDLAKKLKAYPGISASVFCSVVPRLTLAMRRDLKQLTGKAPYIIGKDLVVPIKNQYRIPRQVGQDRLVNAYAAIRLYSAPLIVIDSGTAITFDAISKYQAYLGGLIFPGMGISLEALKEKTALLPLVKLQKPTALIGRDTKNSILSGVVIGTAALAKELSGKLKQILGTNTKCIGTGGNIAMIKKFSGMKITINQNLTLIGIRLIYAKLITQSKPKRINNS